MLHLLLLAIELLIRHQHTFINTMPLDENADGRNPAQKIVVASRNPVKIDAAVKGFSDMFPRSAFVASGVSVESGVPEQPFSDADTLRGALNRARNARALEPDASFWVGIEGGVDEDEQAGALQSFAWVVIIGDGDRAGRARTATYYLAHETAELVRGGMELGHADDALFGRTNSKQRSGSVGLLTDDVVTRTSYYVQAVILALIPFKNTSLTFQTA